MDELITAGVVLAALAVGLQTALHLTNALLLDYRVWNFDADADGNALSWLSASTQLAAALPALLLGTLFSERRLELLALGSILAYFSLDDVAAIHERLGQLPVQAFDLPEAYGRVIWPLLYFPLLGFVFLLLLGISRRVRERAGRLIRLSLALLVLAVLLESSWTVYLELGGSLRTPEDAAEVAVEEGLELGAWILIATALAAYALDRIAIALRGGPQPP